MKIDMLMPQMGESITEATIAKWLKNLGEVVEKDEIILEITTDKVDSEIPAPASGVLTEVLFNEGEIVPVKSKIAVIDSEASANGDSASVNVQESEPQAEEEQIHAEVLPPEEPAPTMAEAPNEPAQEAPTSDRFYSPLVKSLAAKHGVSISELDQIPGSGKGGRFTKDDFMAYIKSGQTAEAAPSPAPQAPPKAPPAQATKPPAPPKAPPAKPASKPTPKDLPFNEWLEDGTKRVPMDSMRRAIAEHMVRSKHTSPHVYTVQEADVSKISVWRKQHKAEFKQREGFNLSYTPFFLEAAIKALQEFPIVNARTEDDTIVYNKDINLGCAVSIGNTGLIVPVIKKADERNLVGLARALNDLASRARDKKLQPDEVMNGTFSITNPGVFGTMIGTPIISQPQSAILCLGAIEKRPVVVDDMIAIRERCYITLSYDHRIIDGAISAQFLAFICDYLANWNMERHLF